MLSKSYKKQASNIVIKLEYLALAIDQTRAYIASNKNCINDFLNIFDIYC